MGLLSLANTAATTFFMMRFDGHQDYSPSLFKTMLPVAIPLFLLATVPIVLAWAFILAFGGLVYLLITAAVAFALVSLLTRDHMDFLSLVLKIFTLIAPGQFLRRHKKKGSYVLQISGTICAVVSFSCVVCALILPLINPKGKEIAIARPSQALPKECNGESVLNFPNKRIPCAVINQTLGNELFTKICDIGSAMEILPEPNRNNLLAFSTESPNCTVSELSNCVPFSDHVSAISFCGLGSCPKRIRICNVEGEESLYKAIFFTSLAVIGLLVVSLVSHVAIHWISIPINLMRLNGVVRHSAIGQAVSSNNAAHAKVLFANERRAREVFFQRETIFHVACRANNLGLVSALLKFKNSKRWLVVENSCGKTPIDCVPANPKCQRLLASLAGKETSIPICDCTRCQTDDNEEDWESVMEQVVRLGMHEKVLWSEEEVDGFQKFLKLKDYSEFVNKEFSGKNKE